MQYSVYKQITKIEFIKGGKMRSIIIAFIGIGLVFCQTSLAPEAFCPVADENGVIIQFNLSGEYAETLETDAGTYVRYHIPTGGFIGEVGEPQIPTWSTTVAIPPTSAVSVAVVKTEWDTIHDIMLYPVQDPFEEKAFSFAPDAYTDGLYPRTRVEVGNPVIVRDFRIAPVDFHPFRYDAKSKTLYIARKMTVEVRFTGTDMRNVKTESMFISEAFDPLYQSTIVNYWFYRQNRELRRGSILYIVRDAYEDDMQALFDWKRKRGHRIYVASAYEDIGGGDTPSRDQIMDYIQNAYDTWEYPPDYVILGGDCVMGGVYLPDFEYITCHTGETDPYASDHQYSLLDGDDYQSDVMVGRLALDFETEAAAYAAKVVSYESNPLAAGSSDWLTRGFAVAANFGGTPQPSTPRIVALWSRELALRHEFDEVDTCFCYGSACSCYASQISEWINDGFAFINYRGWGNTYGWIYPNYRVSNVQGLSNVNMTPFVTSIVCGNGDFNGAADPCFGEAWIRTGTPTSPKGAIAFYGPSDHDTHTKWNNPLDEGIYWGLFEENLASFGQICTRGKVTMWLAYPENREDCGVEHYYYVYNILADPSVMVWKSVPSVISVEAPSITYHGDTRIAVTATDGGAALEGVLASVWFFEGDPYTAYVDESGNAVVTFPAAMTNDHDSVSIVVSHQNYIPHIVTIPITAGSNVLSLQTCAIDDDVSGESNGNDDGAISPGETIELWLTVQNEGSSTATGVQAEILPGEYFSITAGTVALEDIPAGGSSSASEAIVIQMDAYIPDKVEIPLQFAISYSGGTDTVGITEIALAPTIVFESFSTTDDDYLTPGATEATVLYLRNEGSLALGEATLNLTDGRWLEFDESPISISAMPRDTTVEADTVNVVVAPDIIAGAVDTVVIELSDGAFTTELCAPITIGEVTGCTHGGPDPYGYYCYSFSDTASGRNPGRNWYEISPYLGGGGTDLALGDDQTILLDLPFDFKFYGITYNRIGVCSNGWIGMGDVVTWIYYNWYNRPLPDPGGPWGMICPFWDDIDPDYIEDHGVFWQYNEDLHILIIEWHTINAHHRDRETPEWFEVVLRDPAFHWTPTGDGEILFYYKSIHDVDSMEGPDNIAEFSTVGIESPCQTMALQYVFDNRYAPYAEPLGADKPILFTTKPPDAIDSTGIGKPDSKVPENFAMKLAPNPFNPALNVILDIPARDEIDVAVFDISGKLVKVLLNETKDAGKYCITWDGTDTGGLSLPSGVYFVIAQTSSAKLAKKAILIR